MDKTNIQRLATSVVGIPLVLGVVFFAPPEVVFAVFFAAFLWAAWEFTRIARAFAPSAPLGSLMLWVPVAALGGVAAAGRGAGADDLGLMLSAAATLVVLAAALSVLFSATEMRHALPAIGILAFAIPYFALPAVAVYRLRLLGPWWVFVLLAMVWLGDTAAYYVGRSLGRRRLAPRVSPNKTWAGAVAGLVAGVAAAAIWSQLRLGEVRPAWLAVAAATSVAAQLGDLVESLVKRGAGVKDSSDVLPGHGGFYDRFDAMLLAAPVFLLGVWILGFDS